MLHIFDCDGVLIDSNESKAQAFYDTALNFAPASKALEFRAFHERAGSLSRREQWHYFFRNILKWTDDSLQAENQALEECTARILNEVHTRPLVPGVEQYLRSLGKDSCICVSGITTAELRVILAMHRLDQFFSDIIGGPRRKRDILGKIPNPFPEFPMYYGDTQDDYKATLATMMNFTWVSGYAKGSWDNADSGQEFFAQREGCRVITDFTELIPQFSKDDNQLPTRLSKKVNAIVASDGWAYYGNLRVEHVGRAQAGATITLTVPG